MTYLSKYQKDIDRILYLAMYVCKFFTVLITIYVDEASENCTTQLFKLRIERKI